MLHERKTTRICAYRPIRIRIAARAIMQFYESLLPVVYTQSLQAYLSSTHYSRWHLLIAQLIDRECHDTSEDRRTLHHTVINLLSTNPQIGDWLLQCVVSLPLRYQVQDPSFDEQQATPEERRSISPLPLLLQPFTGLPESSS